MILWAKSTQYIHTKMTPLSPDFLAASYSSVIKSVIRPTQDWSSSQGHVGRPDLVLPILDLGSLTLQAVYPTPSPFPQMDPKAQQVTLELVPQWVGG